MAAKVPVRIVYEDGSVLDFESVADCARNFGVSDAAVIKARKRGALHRLGAKSKIGTGKPFRDENGKLWPNKQVAAAAKGVTCQALDSRVKRKREKKDG